MVDIRENNHDGRNAAQTLGLFPGQGAFYKGALREVSKEYAEVRSTFKAIEGPASDILGIDITRTMFRDEPVDIDVMLSKHPAALQLAIFGSSVALFEILQSRGVAPDLLMGHSFGEIAAVVAAGHFTVEQGAEIVCHRVSALSNCIGEPGGMAAIGASADFAARLLNLVDDKHLVVAVVNSPKQTVVAGPKASIEIAMDVAKSLRKSFVPLKSPHAFHSGLMHPAQQEFLDRIRHIQPRDASIPVFSPIFGRYYSVDDDLRVCLAKHLMLPVYFGDSIRQLVHDGVTRVVEVGASSSLARIVLDNLPGQHIETFSPLSSAVGEVDALRETLSQLLDADVAHRRHDDARWLLPSVDRATFVDFWSSRGPQVMSFVRESFANYALATSGTQPSRATRHESPLAAVNNVDSLQTASTSNDRTVSTKLSRNDLYAQIVTLYADALEYPVEAFSEVVELEGELGIDSVKQTELMARLAERYQLPEPPEDFRLSDYKTLGSVVDFVFDQQATKLHSPVLESQRQFESALVETTGQSIASQHVPVRQRAAASNGATAKAPVNGVALPKAEADRDTLFTELSQMYATALEYPVEVFTEDVQLEAELGIDSVKQTEMLTRVADRYQLPDRVEGFRLVDYHTMGRLVDFVHASRGAAENAVV